MTQDEELFLAQYNQVWEQRRQHVTLIWTIPTVGGAVVAFALSQIPLEKLNVLSVHLLFILLAVFSIGAVKIFLRHNFFQRVYGLLLADLEGEKKPIIPLPQIGDELLNRYRDKIKSEFWEMQGSKFKGINSWLLIMASLGLSLFILWLDFTDLPSTVCPYLFSGSSKNGHSNLCFLGVPFAGLTGLIIFICGAFLLLKRSSNKVRVILFVIGSLILILNAMMMSYVIPTMNLEIQSMSDGLFNVERKITDKTFKMRDYQNWDAEGVNVRNILILMEGLDLQNAPQFQRLEEDLNAIKKHALYNLATVSDVNAENDFKEVWPKLSADQLEDEKKKIIERNPSPFKNLFAERDKFQTAKNDKIKRLSNTNWITAVAQGIALLLLATGELLFKFEDNKKGISSSGHQK